MAIEFAKKTEMGSDSDEAVVENSKLPRMSDKPLRAASAKGAKSMDDNSKPGKSGKEMPAVGKSPAKAAKSKAKKSGDDIYPDQVADKGGKASARKAGTSSKAAAVGVGDSYLRLRVRVENGEMSVIEAREVGGPLVMRNTLPSGFAYEVTQGAKRVAVGSVPDAGEWRGFASPSGPPELQVHHVTTQADAEFNVRVPSAEVTLSSLPQTEITLYEVKDASQSPVLAQGVALADTFTNEIREVARLKGIKVDSLSKDAQKEIRRALK